MGRGRLTIRSGIPQSQARAKAGQSAHPSFTDHQTQKTDSMEKCPVGKYLLGVPDTALPDPGGHGQTPAATQQVEVTPSIIGGRLELLDTRVLSSSLGRHDACAVSPLVKWYQQYQQLPVASMTCGIHSIKHSAHAASDLGRPCHPSFPRV